MCGIIYDLYEIVRSLQVMTETTNRLDVNDWSTLFSIAGKLTVLMLVLIPVQIVIFILFPQPQNAEGWVRLFSDNAFLGLLHMDLLYLANNTILVLVYFALAALIYNKNKSMVLIALSLGIIGTTCYFASNKSIEMFFLSRQLAVAEDAAVITSLKQSVYVMLLEWRGTAFTVYYFLNAISLLIFAAVMYRNSVFSRGTAVLGIISAVLMSVPSTFGAVGMVFSLLSLIPWYIFCVRITVVFFKYGKAEAR